MRSDLHHAVDERLVVLVLSISTILRRSSRYQILLPLRVLLRHQPHRQLPDVNRVIRIVLPALSVGILWCRLVWLVLVDQVEIHVVDHCLLLAHVARAWRLYRPEAAAANFVMH